MMNRRVIFLVVTVLLILTVKLSTISSGNSQDFLPDRQALLKQTLPKITVIKKQLGGYVFLVNELVELKRKLSTASPSEKPLIESSIKSKSSELSVLEEIILEEIDYLIEKKRFSAIKNLLRGLPGYLPAKLPAIRSLLLKLEKDFKSRADDSESGKILTDLARITNFLRLRQTLPADVPPLMSAKPIPVKPFSITVTVQTGSSGSSQTSVAQTGSSGSSGNGQTGGQGSSGSGFVQGGTVSQNSGAPGQQGCAEWTFMVFINGDNDLEQCAIKDVNEMETAGSTDRVHILVQLDRSPEYDQSNGDWIGARRFYIKKDSDMEKINSKLLLNLGNNVDMGDVKTVVDFFEYGVKNYPAKKYMFIIWNHGTGWKGFEERWNPFKGISYDETSKTHLDNYKLKKAFEEMCRIAGKKIDIIGMDACLMAMVEIAYQIREYGDFLVASEDVEPGDGWPYMDILSELVRKPGMTARELGSLIVDRYIKSYSGGSQGYSNATLSLVELSKVSALASAVDSLAGNLLADYSRFAKAIVTSRIEVIKYTDKEYVDLYDFAELLKKNCSDSKVSVSADAVMKAIGIPEKVNSGGPDERKIEIASEKPGVVRWTVNGGKPAPDAMWPAGSRKAKDAIISPLVKKGNSGYVTILGPFDKTVETLEYVINYSDGKLTNRAVIKLNNSDSMNREINTGCVVAEGHTKALDGSHGLSIYSTPFEDFMVGYRNLDFAKATRWDEFISFQPEFVTKSNILLVTDSGHAYSDLVFQKFYQSALESNGYRCDTWIPAIFGEVSEDVLMRYKNGVVIWMASSNINCLSRYEESNLRRYLDAGGALFITGDAIEQKHGLSPFFRDYLGARYVEDLEAGNVVSDESAPYFRGLKFKVAPGPIGNSYPSVIEPSSRSSRSIFKYSDSGKTGGIFYSPEGKNFKVVFLGFCFETIEPFTQRLRLMKEIMNLLGPESSPADRIIDAL